jgi:glycosyltransferase involved in cell wall biosynthesis
MAANDVYIVVPAYNEAGRIERVLAELGNLYGEVVVVDDGSTDDTHYLASQYPCTVLRHVLNRGQGAALQTGITFSLAQGASCIVTFDADGQHQVSDLSAVIAPIVRGEVQVTLGSRFLGDSSGVPLSRRIVLQAARFFTWFTSGLYLTDCHNGFRAFSRSAAEQIVLRQDRMAHASELYDQIRRAHLAVREVPVSIRYTADTLAKGQRLANSVNVLVHYLLGKVSW